MKRSKSQAVYKILPGMWISDKDRHGNNVTAQVKSWNYKPMEEIYENFIESEIKRQVRLFSMHGGDIGDYNLDDEKGGFSIVEPACRPGIPDIIAELSPLMYYCPECHRATQFQNGKAVQQTCPICKKGRLKQLQLVYPCECGYASPIFIPKVQGRWIYHNFEETQERLDYEKPFECSVCKHRQGIMTYKFCPNCGTEMLRDNEEVTGNGNIFKGD